MLAFPDVDHVAARAGVDRVLVGSATVRYGVTLVVAVDELLIGVLIEVSRLSVPLQVGVSQTFVAA